MAVNLQFDQDLNPTAQSVKDQNGHNSPLSLSTDAVGIGTTSPSNKFHLVGSAPADANDAQFRISALNGNFILLGRADEYGFIQSHNREPLNLNPIGNNVGIGTTNPKEKLEVNGNILVTGDVKLAGADCAENFDVVEAQMLEPGMVLVIGEEEKLQQCTLAYDKRVAGVISGAGDCKPGIVLGSEQSKNKRMPVALTGKVFCKVDAQYSSIGVGDLLTTSPTPGHAMKATESQQAYGAVIGKALRPLSEGKGLIPILIALQ